MKKIISLLLTVALLFSYCVFAQAEENTYTAGDIITLGSFPQTLITDETLAEELSWYIEEDAWQSLGWYKGEGTYGTMYETDDGKYCDIEYMGEKYRAYTYTHNRSVVTYNSRSAVEEQKIYFFKFEPIQWVLLDADSGYIMALNILDSQAFSNTVYRTQDDAGTWTYYSDEAMTAYCSTWNTSSLRTYLNDTFYSTAFNSVEQTLIKETELTNEVITGGDESYGSENTFDKIFLPSYAEATKFLSDSAVRSYWKKSGTDYAIQQGLFTPSENYALYWLRTAKDTRYGTQISENGRLSSGGDTFSTDWGVSPAMQIDLTALDEADLYNGITVEFNDGILTVSGSGTLPNPERSATRLLAPYKETATAVIIKDGITEISENAFDGFIGMKTLILEGNTVLKNGCLPDSFNLSTVIIRNDVILEDSPFAPDITYINIFEKEGTNCTYGELPDTVRNYTYSYSDKNVSVNGNVTMNAYEFFDLIAAVCEDFDEVNTVSFSSFTSTDLSFYVYDSESGEKELIPDSTVPDAKFSVLVTTENGTEEVSFNTLCTMASDGTLDEFYLVTNSEEVENIEDTELEINTLEDLITYALKWIVSLLNFFFSLFSRGKR